MRGYLRKTLRNVSEVVRENVTLRSDHKAASLARDSAIHSVSGLGKYSVILLQEQIETFIQMCKPKISLI